SQTPALLFHAVRSVKYGYSRPNLGGPGLEFHSRHDASSVHVLTHRRRESCRLRVGPEGCLLSVTNPSRQMAMNGKTATVLLSRKILSGGGGWGGVESNSKAGNTISKGGTGLAYIRWTGWRAPCIFELVFNVADAKGG